MYERFLVSMGRCSLTFIEYIVKLSFLNNFSFHLKYMRSFPKQFPLLQGIGRITSGEKNSSVPNIWRLPEHHWTCCRRIKYTKRKYLCKQISLLLRRYVVVNQWSRGQTKALYLLTFWTSAILCTLGNSCAFQVDLQGLIKINLQANQGENQKWFNNWKTSTTTRHLYTSEMV